VTKRRLEHLADRRSEPGSRVSQSAIVREALNDYFRREWPEDDGDDVDDGDDGSSERVVEEIPR
jgi:predicted transcriptional regulator